MEQEKAETGERNRRKKQEKHATGEKQKQEKSRNRRKEKQEQPFYERTTAPVPVTALFACVRRSRESSMDAHER